MVNKNYHKGQCTLYTGFFVLVSNTDARKSMPNSSVVLREIGMLKMQDWKVKDRSCISFSNISDHMLLCPYTS